MHVDIYTDTWVSVHIGTCTWTSMDVYVYTRAFAYAYMCVCIYAHPCVYRHSRRTRSPVCAYVHACLLIYTCAYTDTYTLLRLCGPLYATRRRLWMCPYVRTHVAYTCACALKGVNFTICRLHLNKPNFEKPQTHYFISYSCGIDPRETWKDVIPFPMFFECWVHLGNVLCLIAWVRAPLNTSGWLRPPRIIISLWKLVLAYPYLTLGKGSVGQCFPLGNSEFSFRVESAWWSPPVWVRMFYMCLPYSL